MTNDVTQPAVIGGDGIGPEVTEQALHVLEQTVGSDAFATHEYHLGAAHWKATGEVLDNSTLAEIAQEVAIVLDAVGATPDSTEVPSVLFGARPFRLIHKHNVLVNAGTLWRRIVDEVVQEFPSVTTDYLHVDLLARRRCHDRSGTRPPAIRRHRHRQPHR
ncbi:3-isopropylmalate dehydrogenase [Cutibacterium acnes JCM 18918]|nr:3-isopropylmalate dehydrogenase [Cutibacterium acnes JCM 18918]